MIKIKFTVVGNQEDPKGNPVPYHRSTQRAKFSPDHQRYIAYKEHVRDAFEAERKLWGIPPIGKVNLKKVRELLTKSIHPIMGSVRGRVVIWAFFGHKPCRHGDPDNIGKGILDALFADDSHVDLETHHACGHVEPKVDVVVEIDEE